MASTEGPAPPAYNPNAAVQQVGAQPAVQYVYAQPPQGQPVQYVQQPAGAQGQVIYVQQAQAPPAMQQPVQIPKRPPTFGLISTHAICPQCQQEVSTKVKIETGGATWACAGILCLFGCWCGCSCLPFCMDNLKDAHHSCPNCNTRVGTKTGNICDCLNSGATL